MIENMYKTPAMTYHFTKRGYFSSYNWFKPFTFY